MCSISKRDSESCLAFYDRIVNGFRLHLAPAGVEVDGIETPAPIAYYRVSEYGLNLELGLHLKPGLHLEQRLHLEPGMHLELWLHLESWLYLELNLHLESVLYIESELNVKKGFHFGYI